ncbi:MAG: Gfo/Idh/MocA family oxidoreductase, partial [Candidatus Aminicenantes bacterium]
MVTLGVIGCGHWGPNHIRNFSFLQNVSVKSCADIDEDRLKQMKSLYPDIITTTDYMDILNDEEVNAVVVATPTATHYKIIKDAFEKGKDVLCEKPMTIDVDESKELVELSNNLNFVLMVGNVFLFNAGIQKLRELIREKQLGKIYYIHCTRTNLGPIRDDVNSVYDLASHDVYIS